MSDRFKIRRSNDNDLRQQIGTALNEVDDDITDIIDYLGAVPPAGIVVDMKWSIDTTPTDPTAGYVKTNNAVYASVTELYVSYTTDNGNDMSVLLQAMDEGDIFGIFQQVAPNNTAYYEILAAGTDNGSWITFPVTTLAAGGQALPTAQDDPCRLYFIENPGRYLPSGGNTDDILWKDSPDNYDADWSSFVHSHNGDPRSGGIIDHAVLGNVLPDQHHPREHNHTDPLDGFIDHESLTNVLPDQHHNQVHLLYGPDQSDVDHSGTPLIRHGLFSNGSQFQIEYRMNWRGNWGPQTYYTHDVVYDEGWSMVANKETTDRAAPQTVGDPTYTLPEVPSWTIYQNTSVIYSGHLYTFTSPGYFRSLRIWVPELTGDTNYAIVIVRNPNSANPTLTRINDPILNENAWTTIGAGTTLVSTGEELLVYIDALNSGGSIQPGGTPADWIRATSSNTADPLTGQWNTNVQETLLRIHQNDADANLIDLSGVIPGSTFQFVDINDPNTSVTYLAQSAETLVGGVYSWTVVIDSIGTNGAPAPTDRCLTTIIVPVAAATTFVGIPAYWGPGTTPTWAGVESFLQYDGVPQAVTGDEAYGIDISFQELVASPDWDFLSIPGGGGGGGEGGGEFPEVPDDGITYGRQYLQWNPVYTKEEAADALLGESWPSGLINGGEVDIAAGTDVLVNTGTGIIVDAYTNPEAVPVKVRLVWDNLQEAMTLPAQAGEIRYFSIANTGTPAPPPDDDAFLGQLVQRTVQPTPAQQRDEIFVGYALHNGVFWKDVSSPYVINQAVYTLAEYIRLNGITSIESGGEVTEAALLTLDMQAGVIWEQNRNWHVNKKDPNREAFGAQLPISFEYIDRNFNVIGAPTSTVDPTQWDDAGTVSPVGGPVNSATIQRIYLDPADNFWILYGQRVYDNYIDAAANIGADNADAEIPYICQRSILLGYIICERTKADWDEDEARFLQPGEAGGGGGGAGATTFVELTDTPSNYVGSAGKVPTVTDAEDGLFFVPSGGVWKTVTNAQVAENRDQFACDSRVSPFTITLPTTPAVDDWVAVADVQGNADNNNITLDGGLNPIDNVVEPFILDVAWGYVLLVWDGTMWAINPDAIGTQGPQGVKGDVGEQGPQGDKGDTGDTGPQGPIGPDGPQGIQGEKGDKGDTGDTGPQGPTGPDGPQGPQGVKGDPGTDGTDGVGVPPGGDINQVLTKVDNVDYNTIWADPAGGGYWSPNGDDIYNNNIGNVGIGTTNPQATLHLGSDAGDPLVTAGLLINGVPNPPAAAVTANIVLGDNGFQAFHYNTEPGGNASAAFLTFLDDINEARNVLSILNPNLTILQNRGGNSQVQLRANSTAGFAGETTILTADGPTGGVIIGNATGGSQGAGTLNATGLYVNGVAVGGGGGGFDFNANATYPVNEYDYYGETEKYKAGGLITKGDMVGINVDTAVLEVLRADSVLNPNNGTYRPPLGIALNGGGLGASITVFKRGLIKLVTGHTVLSGSAIYLGRTGKVVSAKPAAGDAVWVVGYAPHDDIVFMNITNRWEVA